MIPIILTLFLALVLCADCSDKGLAVSTDSQATRATEQMSQLERGKALSAEKHTRTTITVPVSPLIGEAWGELLQEETTDPNACRRIWTNFQLGERNPDNPEDLTDPVMLPCAFFLGHKYAFTSTIDWQFEPQSPSARFHMVSSLSHVLAVNNIASEIAAHISMKSYNNSTEAKTHIKEMLQERKAMLMQVYSSISTLASLSSTIDTSSKAESVAFSKGAYHLALGPSGAVLTYSGVDWFGKGILSGKRYELQLASMIGIGMTNAKSIKEVENANLDDIKRMQGTWRAISIQDEGEEYVYGRNLTVLFQKDRMLVMNNGTVEGEGTFRLDSSKFPKWFDFTNLSEKPGFLGIYKLEGDTLLLCHGEKDGITRPTAFASEAHSPNKNLIRLKRVNP